MHGMNNVKYYYLSQYMNSAFSEKVIQIIFFESSHPFKVLEHLNEKYYTLDKWSHLITIT